MTIASSASVASFGGGNSTMAASEEPSAPSPGLVLFNTEEQSDIVFNVGVTGDPCGGPGPSIWRFPAHSFIVAEASPVFATIIRSQLDHAVNGSTGKPEIFIPCQPEIFHIVLSYIYKKEANIGSVSNGLALVLVSSQFMLHELCRDSLAFLQRSANASNVLEILAWLRRVGPAAGPFGDNLNEAESALDDLKGRCYAILDANAEKILRCAESVDSLEQEMLIEILSRDSLRLASESTAFECLQRWACQQCLKQRRELVAENKRDVLGKAVYGARYLVMTMEEFMRGPYSSDLLVDEEKSTLLACLQQLSNTDNSPTTNHLIAQTMLPLHLCGKKLDVVRKYVKPTGLVSPSRRPDHSPAAVPTEPVSVSPTGNGQAVVSSRSKKSASKKLLNGLSGFLICVIQLLD